MHNKRFNAAELLSVSAILLLSGCQSGDDAQASSSHANVSGPYPGWLPSRVEVYSPKGALLECTRNRFDENGRIIRTITARSCDAPARLSLDYHYEENNHTFTTSAYSVTDPVPVCQRVVLNDAGAPEQIENYFGTHMDRRCRVNDARLDSIEVNHYDQGIYQRDNIRYTLSGGDRATLRDDLIQVYRKFSWNDAHTQETEIWYSGPGPDRKWFTADDQLLDEYSRTDFSDDMKPLRKYTFRAGPDHKIRTADDQVYIYFHYEYQNGVIREVTQYISPGLDGKWETVEDNTLIVNTVY